MADRRVTGNLLLASAPALAGCVPGRAGLGAALLIQLTSSTPEVGRCARSDGLTGSRRVRPDVGLGVVVATGLPGARVEVAGGDLVGAQYLDTPGPQPQRLEQRVSDALGFVG